MTLAHCSSSLASISHISSPSNLPGSYPTSLLASTALYSSINTHSCPALPAINPELTFPTPPVSQLSQPAPHPLDSAALLAPPSIPMPVSTTISSLSLAQCSPTIPSTLNSSTSQPSQLISQSPAAISIPAITASIATTPAQEALLPTPNFQPASVLPAVPSSQPPYMTPSQLTLSSHQPLTTTTATPSATTAAPPSMSNTTGGTGIMPTL